MTATEELRRMLDERGVEWRKGAFPNEARTYWSDVTARPWNDQRLYVTALLTPEQAIAATLGRGTCQDLGGTGANDEQVFNCSECGCVLSLYDRDGSNNLCTSFIVDYPRYCPECGRKVVDE